MKQLLWACVLAMFAQFAQAEDIARFVVKGDRFELDGKPFVIRSGEMHYPRVPKAVWRDRLAKMKAMGLNTVSTYVFWNLHEPKAGEFDFSDELDLVEFVRIAKEEGLWVILRPGPYICAEWEFGGLPSWLLKDRDIKVRTSDARFVTAATRYLLKVGEVTQDLLIDKGGPILMVQVENEYGSFGTDRAYMRAMGDAYAAAFPGLRYTTDSVWGRPNVQRELSFGTLPELPMSINFGQTKDPGVPFRELEKFRPGSVKMSGEYWSGWFDTVGNDHAETDTAETVAGLEWMLSRGISFNIYMFHGGTNFGFMNGANWDKNQYKPDTTSYDYDAPLDEAGRPTEKYARIRAMIQRYLPKDEVLPAIPVYKAVESIPSFRFEESASLWQLLKDPVRSEKVLSMEDLDQSYGFLLYRYAKPSASKGTLELRDLHDFALLFQGERRLGQLDRRLKRQSLSTTLDAETPLDILVENMGRINFSTEIMGERKGITEAVLWNGRELLNWDIYSLPLSDLSSLQFSKDKVRGPAFHKARFQLSEPVDSFLDVSRFGKGLVFVNGKNLGRYWNIGPQSTLYCPASWLKAGENEIVVLDLYESQADELTMKGVPEPIYIKTLGQDQR